MKASRIYKSLVSVFCVSLFLSCTEDVIETRTENSLELVASFGAPTRVGMSIRENSLDVVSRWEGSDHLQVYCAKDGFSYLNDVKDVSISEIYDNGESAKFVFNANDSWKDKNGELSEESKFAYITNRCSPKYDNEKKKLFINASVLRNPIENFNAPVYAIGEFSERELVPVSFKHFYTYELMHITNNTDEPLSFSFNGYEGTTMWFRTRGSICIDDEEFYKESVAVRDPVEYTDMTINPHETRVLMSAYIPNGQKINDVRLVVTLNGNVVKTSNTLTSDVVMQKGHAYHMYVTWNGKKLAFGDIEEEPETVDGVEYVDLGLPSGNLWATCNLGASTPEEAGFFYGWGETKHSGEEDLTNLANYKYCGSYVKTFYSKESYKFFDWDGTYRYNSRGYDFPNGKYIKYTTYGETLEPEDDAATQMYGGSWCIPNDEDFKELLENTTYEIQRKYAKFTSKIEGYTDKYIIIPCDGNLYRNEHLNSTYGYLWSATKDADGDFAGKLSISYKDQTAQNSRQYRYDGLHIRPIYRKEKPEDGKVNGHEYVDLGLSVKWATCNVGANAPEEYGGYFAW